jgi:hypothetical protein
MLHQFPESALDLLKPTKRDEPSTNSTGSAAENIDGLVDLAFPSNRSTATSRLTFEQFSDWCERTPGITNVSFFTQSMVAVSHLPTHGLRLRML